MPSELDTLLSDVGYAKVIVALKPQVAMSDAAAAESALAAHFTPPSAPEAADLAAAAMSFASRTFRRPKSLAKRGLRVYPHLGLAVGTVDKAGADSLAADNRVDTVVPAPEISLIRPVKVTAAKATAAPTWGIQKLKAEKLWEAGFTGKGVLVGHLDTGVDGSHSALRNAIDAFAEFDWAGDQVVGAQAWDSGKHGTHTAGTIAGRPGTKGAIGVAPEAKLASALVIEGGQVIDRVLAGMDWVLSRGARILSMSLGLRGYTPAFQVVVDALVNNNVVPVIAVGNEGPDSSRSPGNYDNVLSVGASDHADAVADFSGSQTFQRPNDPLVPDLVAPGVNVLSCVPGNAYAYMDGSSMATPHVAGLVALLLQAKPTATVTQLINAIYASCRLQGSMTALRANRGLPDAVAAFAALTGNAPVAVRAILQPKQRTSSRRKRNRGSNRSTAAVRKKAKGARRPRSRKGSKARARR